MVSPVPVLEPLSWSAPRDPESMWTPRQVQIALRAERARADRAKGEFSLVAFHAEGRRHAGDGEDPTRRVARILLRRARVTDAVGWYAPGTPCAILPHTPAAGAGEFADDIRELARSEGLSVRHVTYTYPSAAWLEGEALPAGIHERLRADDPSPHKNGRDDDDGGGGGGGGGGGRPPGTGPEPQAKPIEPLLVRPLPIWKRCTDVAGASLALLACSPMLVGAMAATWLTSGRPVFFKQKRVGLGGRVFDIYKLRTMVVDAERQKAALRARSEQDGPAFKMTHDPRVTPLGRLLRRTSIDELPQLWNVLRGDMSLVGPRPLPVDETGACDRWHRQRLDVTPGLTCIWQVRGRSRVTFTEWMRMDMEYIRRRNPLEDLKILVQTVPAVLRGKGAK